ncbi:MAG: FG-GAP-like repeat-containing protein, partial [Planctomycetota bacterium]
AARRASAASLVQRAGQAAAAGRATAARSYYQQALELDPENPQALLHTASARQQDGQLQEALELLRQITAAPADVLAKTRFLEATIALQQHRAVAAETLFLEASQLDPLWAPPLRDLLPLYALQQRTAPLLQTLARLESLRPLNAAELAMRLLAAAPLIPAETATPRLQQSLAADPADAFSLRALLLLQLAAGQPAAALQMLNQYSAIEAASPAVQQLRLLLQARSGDTQFASPYMDQLILRTAATTDALEAALRHPLVTTVPERRLAVAKVLQQQQPWSPGASHELAEALNAAGQPAAAAAQHTITRSLDQLELLAWRVFRPQAAIPEMGLPLYLEISSLLLQMNAADEARKWLLAAETLTPATPEASALLARQRQALELALRTPADPTASPPRSPASATTAQLAALPADFPPLPVLKKPLTTPDPAAPPPPADASVAGPAWEFVDVAAAYHLDFAYDNGGSKSRSIVETIGGGSAILDFDCDDWPDVFLPQGPSGSDRLYRNIRGREFVECSAGSAAGGTGHGLAATAGDFDCDGFTDLCVTRLGTCRLLRNNGDGSFSDATTASLSAQTGCSSGACFADLDQDGFPELFVLNYVEDWDRRCINSEGHYAICDPRELRPAVNRLYRNSADGDFEDITESSGLATVPGRALGILAADLTCDGRLDLFVANDGLPNSLFTCETDALRLQNIATTAGVAVPESGRAHAGMGAAVADFNADALPDLFVTNFYREVNTLYQSLDCGLFGDFSQRSQAGPPSLLLLGFGVQPLDAENDGLTDLVILNGDIDDYSASGRPWKMPTSGLRGLPDGRFLDMAGRCGSDFAKPQLGRGLSRLDFDADGRVDLLAVRHDGPVRLFQNQTPAVHPGVQLRLIGPDSNRSAVGTAIDCQFADGQLRRFWLTTGDGFAATNEPRLFLPAAGGAVTVSIPGQATSATQLATGNWACRLRSKHDPVFYSLPH